MGDEPLKVLVVEDEALLAMDVVMTLEDMGHQVIGEAASFYEVEALLENPAADLALVDIQLARGTSGLDVSHFLRARWPSCIILFVTANPLKVPADFAGAQGVIAKPFSHDGLVAAIAYVGALRDGRDPGRLPAGFTPAPRSA